MAGFTGTNFCRICGKRDWLRRSEPSKSGMLDRTVRICFCQALRKLTNGLYGPRECSPELCSSRRIVALN